MAGIGPAPKQSGRRRRNVPARGEWVDLVPLERPVLPELPELAEGSWNASSVALWSAWRSDPVSALWSPADVAFALETILLHQVAALSKTSEIRLRSDSLGLTPKGKRDLRWRIVEAAAEVEGLPKLAEVRTLRAVDSSKSDREGTG